MTRPPRIAYFISPHGYGHAARAAAVMNALAQLEPEVHFDIFTQVPAWFFHDSLVASFTYHALLADIGLAQKNSLVEDMPETLRRLADFLPFPSTLLGKLAQQLGQLPCRLAVCDISPLGIAVAKAARLPVVLIENFTWDWIYEGYLDSTPQLKPYVELLRRLFTSADYHIQTEPVCYPNSPHLTTRPVSRAGRIPAQITRQKLGIPAQATAILLTMGGIPWDYNFLTQLQACRDYYFIIPGGSQQHQIQANLVLLPHHSVFYHPDLVNASDAVVGKLGYSTLAEVYQAGIPFGYIPRAGFRESEVMRHFVDRHMPSRPITAAQFESGDWLGILPGLLAQPRCPKEQANGAEQVAQFIGNLLKG
jgi:UDP:flavonoid glycosyltransferase YjiC (YdhE family)